MLSCRSELSLLLVGLLAAACAKPSSMGGPQGGGGVPVGHSQGEGGSVTPGDDTSRPELQHQGGTDDDATPSVPAAGASEPPLLCGNAALDDGETCDDGNARPGDGCSGVCRTEGGYECPELGKPCTRNVVCGDGKVGQTEHCDDGNDDGGDGCSATCSVERGYRCPDTGGSCTLVEEGCGNGWIEPGELCDDSNADAGDGCSADCKVEPGYVCPTEGELCQTIKVCGDGELSYSQNEICDDGNLEDGDGCSAACRIEPGWACTADSPSACTYDVVCGDQRVRGAETCDDGNTHAGDGCDDQCQVEPGWACPNPGAACRGLCGDGVVTGREECDDANTDDGDGCSATCQEEPGWVCPEGQPCRATVCGDGQKEGSESCDDGNGVPFDGCSSECVSEPRCGSKTDPVGPCVSVCGDGILLGVAGEECDDGNQLDGDGCTADCRQETGFDCRSFYEDPPESLRIPIIYRDFQNSHPDFGDWCCGEQPGIVESLLDANRKPVYAGTDALPIATTSGKTGFDQWYRDVPDVNLIFYETLTLNHRATGEYSMDSDADEPWATRGGFYPLENEAIDPDTGEVQIDPGTGNPVMEYWGFGNEWLSHNYLFTSELRYWFEYQGGERLDFSGDDDVFVFVNGKLAVDLGGVHGRQAGSVTLTLGADGSTNATYGLEQNNIYEIVVFQAERWCCESNYWLTLSSFVAGRSLCAPVCGDGILTPDEACDLGTDAQGESRNTGVYGGCTPECTLAPYCGDGAINGDEKCDDGSNVTPYDQSGVACGPDCKPHFCGDGMLDTAYGEICDQGPDNAEAAYGPGSCTATCEPGPYCGDGLKNGDEACDEGSKNGTAASLCDLECRIKCGNGAVDSGEECDLGDENNQGGYGGCEPTCMLGPRCGDGVPNGSEECDDGTNDGSYGTCRPDCTVGPFCGDGSVDGPEQCDLGDGNETDPYGPDRCTTECSWAPYCGDGLVQPPEECDGGQSCDSKCKIAPIL
jgi:fibro-slime domain-containing protein